MVPLALFHILVGKSSGEREPANGGHGGQTNGDSGWRGLDDEMEMMEIKSAKNISSFLVRIFRALLRGYAAQKWTGEARIRCASICVVATTGRATVARNRRKMLFWYGMKPTLPTFVFRFFL